MVHRDRARVAALLAAGVDPDGRGPLGHTALPSAAAIGEPDLVRLLLTAGATPEVRDDAGNTPLLVAVVHGKRALAAVDALLAVGADPDAANDAGATPRAFALAARDKEIGARFAGDPDVPTTVSPLPRIEIAVSTPSKLTLAVNAHELTFSGELIVTEGEERERILYIHALARFDDGAEFDPGLTPLILSYLTAHRFVYE